MRIDAARIHVETKEAPMLSTLRASCDGSQNNDVRQTLLSVTNDVTGN